MAHVVLHLNLLLQTQCNMDSAESWGSDMWAWLTSDSWSMFVGQMFGFLVTTGTDYALFFSPFLGSQLWENCVFLP